jgi:hypothetical protein
LFTEELVIRYPLIVIKYNSLRGTIAGVGLPVGPAPKGPSSGLALMENCIGNPFPPSYFTRRGDGILIPALHKVNAGFKNLLKFNIPCKTITNSFLVMNGQNGLIRKSTSA